MGVTPHLDIPVPSPGRRCKFLMDSGLRRNDGYGSKNTSSKTSVARN